MVSLFYVRSVTNGGNSFTTFKTHLLLADETKAAHDRERQGLGKRKFTVRTLPVSDASLVRTMITNERVIALLALSCSTNYGSAVISPFKRCDSFRCEESRRSNDRCRRF